MTQQAGPVLAAARRSPPVPLRALTRNAPILVLTPHPDDESLGCGGLIAACRAATIPVQVVLLTDGAGSHRNSPSYTPSALSALRLAELAASLAELGVPAQCLSPLNWPDAAAPTKGEDFRRAVRQVADAIGASGARTIFSTWADDPHCDHAASAAIAASAAAATGIRHFAYPVWGWTLPPGHDVTAGAPYRFEMAEFLPAKRRAVFCHKSQLGLVIHDAAEAFTLPDALLSACLTESEIFFEQGVSQ